MSKILDKLGIYDLVAVLLSGISIVTFSLLVLQFVYKIHIDIGLQINETLSFLVMSYFIGLIFQELGSLLQKAIYRKNGLLIKALETSEDSHLLLTKSEKEGVYKYVNAKTPTQNNDNIIYNYCKFYVMKNCDTSRIDKDQSLSAMSRSISLYFFILTVISLSSIWFYREALVLALVALSALFSVLLYYRCIRFAKLRYINIFRTFYYNVVVK